MINLKPVQVSEKFGIFYKDTQVYVDSGKSSWSSVFNAKAALRNHFKKNTRNFVFFKARISWEEIVEHQKIHLNSIIFIKDKKFFYFEEGELIKVCDSRKEMYDYLLSLIEIREIV